MVRPITRRKSTSLRDVLAHSFTAHGGGSGVVAEGLHQDLAGRGGPSVRQKQQRGLEVGPTVSTDLRLHSAAVHSLHAARYK